ncbi:MAG: hypothetical protein Q9195_003463 [Heterodermia aff. obscurata]
MARHRAGSAAQGPQASNAQQAVQGGSSEAQLAGVSLAGYPQDHQMPTIRLIPHQDPRASRPSLLFPPTSRTLPHEECVIRVGRYSERDTNPNPPPNAPSSAPVGFKSKVVSRRHCEFWCSNGQWYIKDVKSSSGTFLNHIRLSAPSVESRPFPVNDGDVVQLGIDFRGGEEMIFRCVKIRVECNRAWQKSLNNFKLRQRIYSFVGMLNMFDVHSADVDDPNDEDWEDEDHEVELNKVETHGANAVPSISEHNGEDMGNAASTGRLLSIRNGADESPISPVFPMESIPDGSDIVAATRETSLLSRRAARRISPPEGSLGNGSHFSASPFRGTDEQNPTFGHYLRPITPTQPLMQDEEIASNGGSPPVQLSGSNATEMLIADGPMTPTNNAGPFVFDGSAGRRTATSLETEASA